MNKLFDEWPRRIFEALVLSTMVWTMLSAATTFAQASRVTSDSPPAGAWKFRVTLDGRPIGTHRFDLSDRTSSGSPDERTLISDASFTVKFVGVTLYRYRHEATEQWNGNCLTALNSNTNDDGKVLAVRSEVRDDMYRVVVVPASEPASIPARGCVMSYAYWNANILKQSRLLNAQTGQIENVRIERMGEGAIDVADKQVTATRFRITGAAQPIDVWYGRQGDWVGLDSVVSGNRKLSYRLP